VFNKNKKQYVNILHQNKQLKINYKITQDDKIVKEEHSSFILTDENLPEDAKFKINTLQNNIHDTYIIALLENEHQNIININEIDIINYDTVKYGLNNVIAVPKNQIQSLSRYYHDTGIDYILSPYSIMEEYFKNNEKKNSLNFFIYNNIIYAITFNNKGEIAFSKTKNLTPFESVQDETFSEDDIVGQKLYEEVNFLEIQQFLHEMVEEYYALEDEVEFLEHIEMIYTLKPISEEQIATLQESLVIPISYNSLSVDYYIEEILKTKDVEDYNFITIRKKEVSNKNTYLWLFLILFSILLGGFLFTYQEQDNRTVPVNTQTKIINKQSQPKTQQKKEIDSIQSATLLLPDHKQYNTINIQTMQMLFDAIPYDAILKDIEINKDSSTYVTNFITNSISLSDMQNKLNNIYQTSKVLLEHRNKVILNTIVQNNILLNQSNEIQNIEYKLYNFLPIAKATTYLKGLAIKNSLIKFERKTKGKYLTYNFSVTSKIDSPKEFFDFINKLNLQKLSVKVDYPIVFSKTADKIEVKYKVQISQQNKKEVSLKM